MVDLVRARRGSTARCGQGAPRRAARRPRTTRSSSPPGEGEGAKEAVLKVTIQEAREKVIPALDDEFAKDTGEADTLVEMREKTKTRLIGEDEKQAKNEARQSLLKSILAKNPFPVAPALVDRQLDALVHRAKIQMMMRGIDPRAAEAAGQLDNNKMRDDLREEANDEVRAAFLVDAIATVEKIEVSDAEFEKKVAEQAEARGKSRCRSTRPRCRRKGASTRFAISSAKRRPLTC